MARFLGPKFLIGHVYLFRKAECRKEGVVINLRGSARFRPASKHGLPFVAFTRSESFAMTAFKSIPPWYDFVKGRDSDMLRVRQRFVAKLDQMHVRTLAKHGAFATPSDEEAAHATWAAEQARKPGVAAPRIASRRCPGCDLHCGDGSTHVV